MRHDVAVSVDYPRQFILLAAASPVPVLTGHWLAVLGAMPSLGLYGLLHSSVLVASLRLPESAWRKASFVTGAGALAMVSIATARFASPPLAAISGMGIMAVLLTLSSALGAASYGLLIRGFWIQDLPRRAVAWIALCCTMATLLGVPLEAHLHIVGGGRFAIIWWWAFSVALWFHDRLRQIGVAHVRHS